MVSIKSTQSTFGFFLPAEYVVMYTSTKEASRFWGCGQFLPFNIQCILGIKRTFPCSFGDKRMRLLTRVQSVFSNSPPVGKGSQGGLLERMGY